MRILIEGKPVAALTVKLEGSFMLASAAEDAKGRILTPAEATEAYGGAIRRRFRILGEIAIALMLLIAIVGAVADPIDGWLIPIGAIVIGGAFLILMQLLLHGGIRTWNDRLGHRPEGLPPAATRVAIDAKGLMIGTETLPWSDLAIDQIELSKSTVPSGDTSTVVYIIERLSLAGRSRTVILDRAMIENGQMIVDNVWRRLGPRVV
jgi:hypothetical protein